MLPAPVADAAPERETAATPSSPVAAARHGTVSGRPGLTAWKWLQTWKAALAVKPAGPCRAHLPPAVAPEFVFNCSDLFFPVFPPPYRCCPTSGRRHTCITVGTAVTCLWCGHWSRHDAAWPGSSCISWLPVLPPRSVVLITGAVGMSALHAAAVGCRRTRAAAIARGLFRDDG